MLFWTAQPCLCYPLQQYLLRSYHIILHSIYHRFGINVVCVYLHHENDVSVLSTLLHKKFSSLVSVDCFFYVPKFTIHILFFPWVAGLIFVSTFSSCNWLACVFFGFVDRTPYLGWFICPFWVFYDSDFSIENTGCYNCSTQQPFILNSFQPCKLGGKPQCGV